MDFMGNSSAYRNMEKIPSVENFYTFFLKTSEQSDKIVMFSWKNCKKHIYKIYPIKEAKKKDSRFFEDPTG